MLTENPGFCHWCPFHLYKLFSNTQSFTCIKDSSSIPGLSNWAFILLPGKLKQPLSELTRATTGFSTGSGSGWISSSPKLSYSTPHLETFPFVKRQRLSPLHLTNSENKRENPRRTPQERACRQGWKTSSFVPDSVWTKNLPVPGSLPSH